MNSETRSDYDKQTFEDILTLNQNLLKQNIELNQMMEKMNAAALRIYDGSELMSQKISAVDYIEELLVEALLKDVEIHLLRTFPSEIVLGPETGLYMDPSEIYLTFKKTENTPDEETILKEFRKNLPEDLKNPVYEVEIVDEEDRG